METGADSRDVVRQGLRGNDCGLRGDNRRLGSHNGSLGELTRDDAEGVGLGEEVGLGEGVDRGLWMLLDLVRPIAHGMRVRRLTD